MGTVVAIDLATTEVVWARRLAWPQGQRPRISGQRGAASAPVVVGNRVLLTQVHQGSVLCVDSRSGELVWHQPGLRGAWLLGVADDVVFFHEKNSLLGLGARSGKRILNMNMSDRVTGRGFVAEDALYVPTRGGLVRVDWSSSTSRVFHRYGQGVRPSRALVPLGRGLASSHADRTLVFGMVKE